MYDQNDKLFLTGRLMANNLYQLDLEETQKLRVFNVIFREPNLKDIVIWHNRLAHVNFYDLLKLRPKLQFDSIDVKGLKCTHCLLGKATRLSFIQSCNRAIDLLELIHFDFIGHNSDQ